MTSSVATFPARFAELVYLLANRPDTAVEQEAALGAAASAVMGHAASLTTTQVNVDLLDVGQTMVGEHLHELVMRMSAHSAHQIDFAAGAPREEILGVARILAGHARPNDDGAAFDEKLLNLSAAFVEAHLGRNGFVRTGSMTPSGSASVGSDSVRSPTPFGAMPAIRMTPPHSQPRAVTPATSSAVRSTPIGGSVVSPTPPAPSFLGPAPTLTPPSPRPMVAGTSIRDDSSRIIEGAIQSKPLAVLSDEELIARLNSAVESRDVRPLLDELATVAEARAREHRWDAVGRIFLAIGRGEVAAERNPDLRRAYAIALRRVSQPTSLRGIASLLPRRPDIRDDMHEVLLRAGADGAEALIDLLTTADVLTDRRAYLAALVKCRDAVPTLIHLLGDGRWYVVRNAADLLGEMRAPEAENRLVEIANHREERVRRSVATALARLGTPRSIQTAQHMLGDAVPEVRVHAAQALGATKLPRVASLLARALDMEHDPEVQAVILAALGRQATAEAVARLVKAAEPEGRLFKRKPTALRVAAVQALAEANTSAALTALTRLADDKERDVRDAAVRALRPKPDA